MSAITKAALGLLAGKDVISALTKKQKKAVVNAVAKSATSKKRQPKLQKSNTSVVSAPASSGMRVHSVSGGKNMILDVDTLGISLKSSAASGTEQGIVFTDGVNTNSAGVDLKPTTKASSPACFGPIAGQMQSCFSKFRVRRLTATFVPVLPTSTSGLVSFSATRDPVDTTPPSLLALSAASNNVTGPIWCPNTSMDLSKMLGGDDEWYFCNIEDLTVANQRLQAPGSIQGYISGTAAGQFAADQVIGYLKFKAQIEFKDPVRSDLLGSRPPPATLPKASLYPTGTSDSLYPSVQQIPINSQSSHMQEQLKALSETVSRLAAIISAEKEFVRVDPQGPPNTN